MPIRVFRSFIPIAVVAAMLVGTAVVAVPASATAGTTWTQLNPATAPSPRGFATMAYDPDTGQLVLFGGAGGSGDLGDTWTWDGTTWTQLSPATSPPSREQASMAYDPTTGQLVLFGGYGSSGVLNDTWSWDGTTWTQHSPATSPPDREGATMAYDPDTGQLVLFGGYGSSGVLNDTWSWDGTTWTQQSPATSPPAEFYSAMTFDPSTSQLVLFGGLRYGSNGELVSDTWTWDGTTWTQLTPASAPPALRLGAAMTFDPSSGQLVVFGGTTEEGSSPFLNDTWTWDGTEWTQQFPATSPPPRQDASMAYDPGTGQLVLFGGYDNAFAGDTWLYVPSSSPSIDSVTPTSGPSAGGTSVTLDGHNLGSATSVTVGGSSALVTADSATSLSVTTPPGTPGPADVVVTTPDGTVTDTGGFTYVPTGSPLITFVSPSAGPSSGGTSVTIDGTNLGSATSVTVGGSSALVTADSATSLSVTTPPGTPGPADVVVTTPDGTVTDTGGFTYVPTGSPLINFLSQSAGTSAGGTGVTIDGANLGSATSVTVGGNPATVLSDSATQIIVLTPPGTPGPADVVVTTPDGTATDTGGFTYVGFPILVSVSPSTGPTSGGTEITISGSNLSRVNAVSFGYQLSSAVPASSFTVNSPTSITVVTPPHIAGTLDLFVSSPFGNSGLPWAFTYVVSNCEPAMITSGDSTSAVAEIPFSYTVTTTCPTSAAILKATQLPPGLQLTQNGDGTATISGTPAAHDEGSYDATVTATVKHPIPTVSGQTLLITVDNTPVFKSKPRDTVRTGVPFSYPVTTRYGYPVPTITTASTLPDGVTLTDNGNGTAAVGGTPDPNAGGVYPITLTATNGVGSPVDQIFILTVYQAPVVTSADSDTITAGVAMTPFTVTDTGYPLPTVRASGLPTGVHLTNNSDHTGTITGTPKATAAGTYNPTISVSGKSGNTSQAFTLTVTP